MCVLGCVRIVFTFEAVLISTQNLMMPVLLAHPAEVRFWWSQATDPTKEGTSMHRSKIPFTAIDHGILVVFAVNRTE